MAHRTDIKDQLMERPSEDEVMSTAERTKAALEKLVSGKIKAVNPSTVPKSKGDVSFIRYTPDQGDGTKQRIIKMVEVVEDPLEPVKFKGKKIPRGPPSPPPPILRSPPRKVTAQDQKDWMIPPCVSNWKNNKGYTIPLDKRLAADGRGLQDVLINDRFAQFSEALYVADRHAREEVRQRSLMQQKIAQKEKEAKEENLRLLAQRAREERSGIAAPAARVAAGGAGGAMPAALAGYGSDSDSEADSASEAGGAGEDEEDEEAARLRDVARKERNKERERDMRQSNMGQEQRAKTLARATGRDISEKIALGLAKPTMSKDSMLDSRLFNQEQLSGSFADEDSYNLYDKPLFSGSSSAAAIYKPRGANVDDDGNEVAAEEGINRSMQNDRFGLGVAGKHGFEGSNTTEIRDGSVASHLRLSAGWTEADFGLRVCAADLLRSSATRRSLPIRLGWTPSPRRSTLGPSAASTPQTRTTPPGSAPGINPHTSLVPACIFGIFVYFNIAMRAQPGSHTQIVGLRSRGVGPNRAPPGRRAYERLSRGAYQCKLASALFTLSSAALLVTY